MSEHELYLENHPEIKETVLKAIEKIKAGEVLVKGPDIDADIAMIKSLEDEEEDDYVE